MSNFSGNDDGKKYRDRDGHRDGHKDHFRKDGFKKHSDRKFGDKKEFGDRKRDDFRDKRRDDKDFHKKDDRKSFADRKNRDFKDRDFKERDRDHARESMRPSRPLGGAERKGAFGDKGRMNPKQADLLDVCDLDRGIIKLIAKRAKVIERMISFKSLDAATEKAIRTSWEQNTNKYCPDPKISRELYTLIQSVKAIDDNDYDHAYNLAPLLKPVQVELQAPASSRLARLYMFLAAASGQKTCMKHVALTDSLIHTIKSLNVLGGDLWFENNGTIFSREAKGLQRGGDKIIHVGSDEQSLWLCLALCLGLPYHIKITGENELCKINFAPIAEFLAQFNARLVQVIPAGEGLPVRIEASGMIAENILVPENLPMDFVLALVLSAPFWESSVTLDMTAYYAGLEKDAEKKEQWEMNIEDIQDAVSLCSLPVLFAENTISVESLAKNGKSLQLPEEIVLASDGEICTSFFLLPAMTSGSVSLKGYWTGKGQQKYLADVMDFVGLEFTVEGDTATAKGLSGNVSQAEKLPVCNTATTALLALWARVHGKNEAEEKDEAKEIALPEKLRDCPIVESFLAHLGYTKDLERGEDLYAPFMAPSAKWAVAYALGAYLRPRVKLVNPNILNDYYPFFWRMYNTLPNPSIDKAERKDDTPKTRRVIAQGVYATNPEPRDSYDD